MSEALRRASVSALPNKVWRESHNRRSLSDADRERQIQRWHDLLVRGPDEATRRMAQKIMCRLIAGRSPAQVARMEQAKGLRR